MQRIAPPLTPRTGDFWRSGQDGVLRIARCPSCALYVHPPRSICPRCRNRDVALAPVSGRGTIYSYTINRYAWFAGMTPPYILAEVELDEQAGLRLLTNIVGMDIDAVRIGQKVSVRFEQAEETWIPVFAS
jgi:uncharacterized OB-fold protein